MVIAWEQLVIRYRANGSCYLCNKTVLLVTSFKNRLGFVGLLIISKLVYYVLLFYLLVAYLHHEQSGFYTHSDCKAQPDY